MLIEIRKKNQITLPSNFIKQLGLKEGDMLSIEASNQAITLKPVVVIPKEDLPRFHENMENYLASEAVLKKDWLSPEEDEACKLSAL
ncbi:MAG TPA: AbrB/MazE/SpoVT family DNA-binding domain-containing protein [Caldisericia bacterium]|nr:AbrB/MazE/SpoVT family DNA-binding domain-containing protein [Caldisericia bacterium]